MNYNLIDTRPYQRETYLDIFSALHNVDDIPPYPAWPQDNQYYGRHIDTFMEDMQQLLNNDRPLFDQILARIQGRQRGPSEVRTRMIALNAAHPPAQAPAQNVRITGGSRRSRKGSRKSKSKSRKNRSY